MGGAVVGLVDLYATAYILLLGAHSFQIALLVSLPLFLASLIQLKAPYLMEKIGSRKRMVQSSIGIIALTSFLMGFAFLLGNAGVNAIIIGFCIYQIAQQLVVPARSSWVGDVVDENKRGEFFGHRTKLHHIAIFVASLIAGFFLKWMTNRWHMAAIGFCIVYCAGALVQILSLPLLKKIDDPPFVPHPKENRPSFSNFLKNIFQNNYGRFVVYACLVNFAIFISHTFVSPYLLEDLKINYFIFSVLFATLVVAKFAFYPIWGNLADKLGNKNVLIFTGLFFGLSHLLWLFSHHLFYLFCVQAFRGIVWSGFDIVLLKFLLDATTAKNRPAYISYYGALNGMAALCGGMAGGLLVHNHLFFSSYYLAFITASVVQVVAWLILIPKITEPKRHKPLETILETSLPMAGEAVSPGESVPKA